MPTLGNGKNAYSVCVIIDVAQIMAYHKRQGMLGMSLNDWNYMTSTPNAPSNSRVAELIKIIFDEIEDGYDEGGTESGIRAARRFLTKHFTVDQSVILTYGFSRVGNTGIPSKPFLPTYVRGENSSGGHGWVVDGKKIKRMDIYDEYVQYIEGQTAPVYHKYFVTMSTHSYVSCNWGWGDSTSTWLSNFIFRDSEYTRGLKMIQYIY